MEVLGMNWDADADQSLFSGHIRFVRGIDWESSLLGAPSKWPAQLHQFVDFVLADPTPATVMWGDDLAVNLTAP
jgi:hypothetical protein